MKLRPDVTEVLEIITFPKWKNDREQDDVAPIDEADYKNEDNIGLISITTFLYFFLTQNGTGLLFPRVETME